VSAPIPRADAFVIISNDSDLTEPMRIVRHQLGRVGVLSRARDSDELCHPGRSLVS
jgi:hypothetical protein